MQFKFAFLKVYLVVAALIAGWWGLAFKPNVPVDPPSIDFTKQNTLPSLDVPLLSPINRTELQSALAGNISLMAKLMREWDLDAQILHSQGLTHVKRLPHQQYLRCQMLGRALEQASKRSEKARFLPQTFAAASFLLALTTPEEIAALPKKLREQEQLYPRQLTDRIPLDTHRYNSEKLFLNKPQLAFVAHYSHPATLQALENQGILLYRMPNVAKISDITTEIMTIGSLINRPLEAELLQLFIDAAFLAIDNRMAALNLHIAKNDTSPKILFLNYHRAYSIPTQKTLTGQLLKRLGIPDLMACTSKEQQQDWAIPIDKETIVNLNPDCLIISTENVEALKREIELDPAFNCISAVRHNRLFFVDHEIQQTPTQYIVLAYHDLIQALAGLL